MADTKIILETIKRMYDAGLDDRSVSSALDDLGLSEDEKSHLMSLAKGKVPAQKPAGTEPEIPRQAREAEEEFTVEIEPEEVHEKIAEKTAKKIREELRQREASEQFREATAQISLDKQREELERQSEKISDIHKKVSSLERIPGSDQQRIFDRLSKIEKDVAEIKGQNTALQDLLKKVIDVTRKLLTKSK